MVSEECEVLPNKGICGGLDYGTPGEYDTGKRWC